MSLETVKQEGEEKDMNNNDISLPDRITLGLYVPQYANYPGLSEIESLITERNRLVYLLGENAEKIHLALLKYSQIPKPIKGSNID